MKVIYKWAVALSCILLWTGCNDEWTDEQYENYLSFVNPGVTKVYLKYDQANGQREYEIPIQVSGSTMPGSDVNVTVALDPDTVASYNFDNFRSRTDLYYKQLEPQYYAFDKMSTIVKSGESEGFLKVNFSFLGLDTYDNYFLALTIDPSSDLLPNPRKHYKKTLMHINLFNDFSGKYNVSSELIEYNPDGSERSEKIKVETRNSWVVDENTIFFYAGFVDEQALDRKDYRVFIKFIPSEEGAQDGTIEFTPENPDIKFQYDPAKCSYSIAEAMDPLKPYLKRRYVTVNMSYTYHDITNPDYLIKYKYEGPMIMERVLNILKPEEDQIEWN